MEFSSSLSWRPNTFNNKIFIMSSLLCAMTLTVHTTHLYIYKSFNCRRKKRQVAQHTLSPNALNTRAQLHNRTIVTVSAGTHPYFLSRDLGPQDRGFQDHNGHRRRLPQPTRTRRPWLSQILTWSYTDVCGVRKNKKIFCWKIWIFFEIWNKG